MRTKGIIYTVISAILFGITPILASWVYAYGISSITIVFFRSLFVLPILYVLMKSQKISLHIQRQDLKHTAIIAIFGSGLTTILLFTSYQYIDVGMATTLHFLYPLCVSLLCYLVYQETLGRSKVFALILAAIGTLCFFDTKETGSLLGICLAITSAVAYAFYMVQLSKKHLTKQNPYLISFYMALFTVFETVAYHIFVPSITLQLPMQAYFILILLSIVSSFLGVVLLQLGIRELGPSTASLFCLFEPITSIIAGVLLLHNRITFLNIIGCMVILSSLVIITLAEKQKEKYLQ
ncbi:DMT family transporter [Amedibacillus sp. YH-ame10]